MISYRRDPGGWLVRWDSEVAAQAIAEGSWPNRTIVDFAMERTSACPHKIQFADGDNELSRAQLMDRARRLADYFLSIGLKAGDVVSFQLPNGWEAVVISLATAMTGLVVNPIVPINRDAEVGHILHDAATRVMVIPAQFRTFDYVSMMARLRGGAPKLKAILVTGMPVEGCPFDLFDEVLEKATPLIQPVAVDPDAVKLLMYTSGTTGRPKGVLHSHNTLFADAFKMRDALGLNFEDRIFCPSPITHVTGFLWLAQMPWYGDMLGATLRTWDAKAGIALIQKFACSVMLGATPFLQDLVTLAKQDGQQLQSLRHYVCGGAAVPPTLIYSAAQQFPNCIPWRTFGATEVCTLTVGPTSRDDLRFGAETDGRLSGVRIKLVGIHDGREVAVGEEGELLVKTASMSLGYANPADNEQAYDEDGYFRMGDLGRIVDGDCFVCTGRKKDLIIRGGENISAKEIEDVLVRSPKILEAAVVSMPSKRTGEAICAFIVPEARASIDMKEVADLISGEGLAKQKTPEHVEIVAELPKTPAGKVRKDVLRARAVDFAKG